MLPTKIALTSNGPKAGKTTLAKHLERYHGFTHVEHTRTLVTEFCAYYNDLYDLTYCLTPEDVYASKEAFRRDLQNYADELGFSSPERAREWTMRTLARYPGAKRIVFDNFRGEVQGAVMRSMGFVIVQLEVDESERARRCHSSEEFAHITAAMHARPDIESGIKHPHVRINTGVTPVDVAVLSLMNLPIGNLSWQS